MNRNIDSLVIKAQGVTGISLNRLVQQFELFSDLKDAVLAVQDVDQVSGQTVRYPDANQNVVRDLILDVPNAISLAKAQSSTTGISVAVYLQAHRKRIETLIDNMMAGMSPERGVIHTAVPATSMAPIRTVIGNTDLNYLKLELLIANRMVERGVLASNKEERDMWTSLYERISGRDLKGPVFATTAVVPVEVEVEAAVEDEDEESSTGNNALSTEPNTTTVSQLAQTLDCAPFVVGKAVKAVSARLGFDIRSNDAYCRPYYDFGNGDRMSTRNIIRYRLTDLGVQEITTYLFNTGRVQTQLGI